MKYEISGTVMQTVAIDLEPGEQVYSQSNTMAWMNDAVVMDTHTGGGFLATLTGPGRVWLQSMPIMNLAEEVGRYLPQRKDSS